MSFQKMQEKMYRWSWTKTLTCELCGFEPKTKNKFRERQDHLVMEHFKDEFDKILPYCRPYICPSQGCGYTGHDKQSILRHYTGKHHGILEKYLEEALAAKGITTFGKLANGDGFEEDFENDFLMDTSIENPCLKKNYPCEIYKKEFNTKSSLKQHLINSDSDIISCVPPKLDYNNADSKRIVNSISNHNSDAISEDKKNQTQIIDYSVNPPHHHIEIIAVQDSLPKSPVPVVQDRTLYKGTFEKGDEQIVIHKFSCSHCNDFFFNKHHLDRHSYTKHGVETGKKIGQKWISPTS
jgi:hypothetical protein